jgi:hypothetical protein
MRDGLIVCASLNEICLKLWMAALKKGRAAAKSAGREKPMI